MPTTTFRFPTATATAAVAAAALVHSMIRLPLYNATSYLPVSSPRFGGCRTTQTSTSTISYCALKPSDCTPTANSPYEYLPPHLITTTQCNKPHQVTIGRCASSLDNNLCSAFPESCTIRQKFQPRDDTCKLVQTPSSAGTNIITRYPQCRIPIRNGRPSVTRCVLSAGDCVDGEEFLNMEHLPWNEPCHCHQVSTGMCHLNGVSPITADASFCAVGGYDCPGGYNFMSSALLLNMVDPPRQCLLCRDEDVDGIEVVHKSIVESGGCFADDVSFLRCALESSECNTAEREVFMSSMQMYEMGKVPCSTDNIAGGECTSSLDSVGCTNKAEACELPSKFEPRDTCTLHSDTLNKGEKTWFGRCRDKNKYRWCVWGSAECDVGAGDIWYAAKKDQNWLSGCNCEDVKTGACRSDGSGAGGQGYYCAVSRLGCDDPSSYISSRNLMEQLGLDCRLCHPRREVFIPTQSPTKRPVGPPELSVSVKRPVGTPSVSETSGQKLVGMPSVSEPSVEIPSSSMRAGQSSDPSTAVILVSALGTMVLMTSLAVFAFITKSKNEPRQEEQDQIDRGDII